MTESKVNRIVAITSAVLCSLILFGGQVFATDTLQEPESPVAEEMSLTDQDIQNGENEPAEADLAHDEGLAVQQVHTQEEFIEQIESPEPIGDITVDKETGKTAGTSFKMFFGEEAAEVAETEGFAEAVEDTGYFEIAGETEDEYTVVPLYAGKQILVDEAITSLHGADNGVSYGGETVLTFSDEETTKEAYEELVDKYGEENVLVDFPIYTEAKGWGTEVMELPSKARRSKAYGYTRKVTVAVIDSGVDKNHEIFKGTTFSNKGKSFIDSNLKDYNGHGTQVSGIIAESTPSNVQIMPLKIIGADGSGGMINMIAACEYAANNGADVINMSVGFYCHSIFQPYVDRKLKAVANKGVVMVAPSGNDKRYEPYHYPGGCPSVICASAIDSNGIKSDFSNWSEKVDFCAPGEYVLCAAKGTKNKYVRENGTSLSTAYITSSCALIKAVKPSANVAKMRSELKCIAVDKGAKGKDQKYGWGMPRFGVYGKKLTSKMITISNCTYTGKSVTPKIVMKDNGRVLKNYSVKYLNGRTSLGAHRVRITGINGYTGSITKTFRILPKAPTIKYKRTNGKKKVYWSKTSGKYQLQIQTPEYRTYTLKKHSKSFPRVYTARVRTVVKSGGKTYYSPWSKWVKCY